jgi:hypothetical protein
MRSWKQMSGGLKLGIVATVILALSIVGVLANERFGGSNDDAVPARETTGPKPDTKPTGKALELGTFAKISSNYRVTVTEVSLYVGETKQYLAATIKAEYTGTDEGEPWADLTVEFYDPKSRVSGESDCPIDVDDASEDPPLAAGEEATYSVCIDLPTKEIKGGKVSIEEAFARGRRAYWSTAEAETKEIPSFALPGTSPRPQPQRPRRPAGNSSANDEWVEEYVEDVEEYREWVEEMDEFAEENKNKFDQDDIDEYEEWKSDYEEQIEEYEKWKKEYDESR